MISTVIRGNDVELLPFDAMVSAADWFIKHGCPTLASALWSEGEDLGDVSSELATIPRDAPPEVLLFKARLDAAQAQERR